MSEHDREISGKAICPRCLCQFQHHSRPQLYECLVEQAIDVKRKSGLPAPGLRILPPRPPNVAALLDEDARLPAAEVGAVVEALFSHRAAKVHLQSLGDPVSPVLDFAERIKSCQNVMDAWDRVEKALDALAALGRKES